MRVVLLPALCLTASHFAVASPVIDDKLKSALPESDVTLLVAFASEQFHREIKEIVLTRCDAPVGSMCVIVSLAEEPVEGDAFEFASGTFYYEDWIERPEDAVEATIRKGKWRTDGDLYKYQMTRYEVQSGFVYIHQDNTTAPSSVIRRLLKGIDEGAYDIAFSTGNAELDKELRRRPDDEWKRSIRASEITHVSVESDGSYLLQCQQSKFDLGWTMLQFREINGRLTLISAYSVRV